jgi:predicted phosphohydrolase
LRPTAETPLFVLWHYPPFDAHRRPGPCAALCQQFSVTACVYGHLHRQSEWSAAVQGIVGGVRFHCVAADAIGFRPLRIETARFPDAPVLPH